MKQFLKILEFMKYILRNNFLCINSEVFVINTQQNKRYQHNDPSWKGYLRSVLGISTINSFSFQDYSLNLYLRQTWEDQRLKYSDLLNTSVTLNYDQISQLWIPDTFFRNLKKGMFHDITVPNRLIRLSPDGTILFSQR